MPLRRYRLHAERRDVLHPHATWLPSSNDWSREIRAGTQTPRAHRAIRPRLAPPPAAALRSRRAPVHLPLPTTSLARCFDIVSSSSFVGGGLDLRLQPAFRIHAACAKRAILLRGVDQDQTDRVKRPDPKSDHLANVRAALHQRMRFGRPPRPETHDAPPA